MLGDIFHGGSLESLFVEQFPGGSEDDGFIPENLPLPSYLLLHYLLPSVVFGFSNHCLSRLVNRNLSWKKTINNSQSGYHLELTR